MKAPGAWWRNAFERQAYPLAALTASPYWRWKTRREVPFLVKRLRLERGSRVLDLACGVGRHAIELAAAGCAVTGWDLSRAYLREAERRARRARVRVRWLRGDMRRLPFSGEFDAAVNLYTSFGYFPRASEDLRTLGGVARSLKPGGLLLLDVVNGGRVRSNLELAAGRDMPVNRWSELPGGGVALEDPRLAEGGRACLTRWIFLNADGSRRTMTSYTRLYDGAGLKRLLRRAGFARTRLFGDFSGAPYRPARSPRLIALAAKPGP